VNALARVVALLLGGARREWKRLQDRRARIVAERDETEQLLRDTFAASGADLADLIDGRWDRSDREIHGMTAPELSETREHFDDLIGREWPDQT